MGSIRKWEAQAEKRDKMTSDESINIERVIKLCQITISVPSEILKICLTALEDWKGKRRWG